MTDLTLDQWRALRGKELLDALLRSTWYAQPNDLIGGYCVMPVPQPPSCGIPEAADFCAELLAVHVAELHNVSLAAHGNRLDPGLIRWCGWPGCFSSYNAATGPTTPGWTRINSPGMVICGPHADRGHFPRLVLGADQFTIRPTCTCGASEADRKATLGELAGWWRQHVEDIPR